MKHLQGTWANRFNRCRGQMERPFQGRYKALHVEPGQALAQVANYIHLNPVRAKGAAGGGDEGGEGGEQRLAVHPAGNGHVGQREPVRTPVAGGRTERRAGNTAAETGSQELGPLQSPRSLEVPAIADTWQQATGQSVFSEVRRSWTTHA